MRRLRLHPTHEQLTESEPYPPHRNEPFSIPATQAAPSATLAHLLAQESCTRECINLISTENIEFYLADIDNDIDIE